MGRSMTLPARYPMAERTICWKFELWPRGLAARKYEHVNMAVKLKKGQLQGTWRESRRIKGLLPGCWHCYTGSFYIVTTCLLCSIKSAIAQYIYIGRCVRMSLRIVIRIPLPYSFDLVLCLLTNIYCCYTKIYFTVLSAHLYSVMIALSMFSFDALSLNFTSWPTCGKLNQAVSKVFINSLFFSGRKLSCRPVWSFPVLNS